MPNKAEGEVRPTKGRPAPIDVDALLYEAMSDLSLLPSDLAHTIEGIIERSRHQTLQGGIQPRSGAARRKTARSDTMT